jgi:acetolactate synthase-1/2/3 large subunit
MTRTGGQVLVDQLRVHGVDTVFAVPGESYLAALDALGDARDAIRLVVCRHEGGAANMAEAYGKLTGRPGICFVTRGPGATNASIGVHTALQDSTPMLLLVGQVARDTTDREAFQEIDFRRMFGQMAKWVTQVDDPRRLPELVSHAFYLAVSGRPGPVVLALPEDMLTEACETADAEPYKVVQAHPGAGELAAMRALLADAHRPLMLVGGGGWSAQASADALAFAEANGLPVAASFRCQDRIDNRAPIYVGDVGLGVNPALAARVRDADVLLAAGPRLGEATTSGYTLVDVPRPRQRLVHVHPGAEELGRVYQPDVAINAGLPHFFAAARQLEPVDGTRWRDWATGARADYEAWARPQPGPGELNLSDVVVWLRERLPHDAVLANGAGNFSVWAHRFSQFSQFATQLGPTSGAMGYGLPAAIAAKLVRPDSDVVCFTGDGDFLMTGQELATAVQQRVAIVVLVVDNGMYGTIRMHQERAYPGRPYGTDLVNPDFVAYARAFGAYGELVERTDAFPEAFERALAAGGPALLVLRVDPEAITPRQSLSEIRAAALEARGG